MSHYSLCITVFKCVDLLIHHIYLSIETHFLYCDRFDIRSPKDSTKHASRNTLLLRIVTEYEYTQGAHDRLEARTELTLTLRVTTFTDNQFHIGPPTF